MTELARAQVSAQVSASLAWVLNALFAGYSSVTAVRCVAYAFLLNSLATPLSAGGPWTIAANAAVGFLLVTAATGRRAALYWPTLGVSSASMATQAAMIFFHGGELYEPFALMLTVFAVSDFVVAGAARHLAVLVRKGPR